MPNGPCLDGKGQRIRGLPNGPCLVRYERKKDSLGTIQITKATPKGDSSPEKKRGAAFVKSGRLYFLHIMVYKEQAIRDNIKILGHVVCPFVCKSVCIRSYFVLLFPQCFDLSILCTSLTAVRGTVPATRPCNIRTLTAITSS